MNPPKPRSPTSFDVAQLVGVSRSAVSRAFTEGAIVAPETRRKIFEAAETLGYIVNPLARGLQTGSSNIVGLVVAQGQGGLCGIGQFAFHQSGLDTSDWNTNSSLGGAHSRGGGCHASTITKFDNGKGG